MNQTTQQHFAIQLATDGGSSPAIRKDVDFKNHDSDAPKNASDGLKNARALKFSLCPDSSQGMA